MYNVHEIENEFLNELQKYGIPPHDGTALHADGKKHRYRIEGDRKHELSGEYLIYLDEWPAGWFKSYSAKHNVPYKTWSLSSKAMGFSDEGKRDRKRRGRTPVYNAKGHLQHLRSEATRAGTHNSSFRH